MPGQIFSVLPSRDGYGAVVRTRSQISRVIYLAIPAVLAGIYHFIALVVALGRRSAKNGYEGRLPPVSILKPVYGRDPEFYNAIRSHALMDYPEFEILFGVRNGDSARKDIARLTAEFPTSNIRIIECSTRMPNAKVGTLADLARAARYDFLVICDGDCVIDRA